MCWNFWIRMGKDNEHKEIGEIGKLIKLFKYYDLEIPKQLINDYTNGDYGEIDINGVDIDMCLCPVNLTSLGDDMLSIKLKGTFGDFRFTKMNDEIVEYTHDLDKEKQINKIEIKNLDNTRLFHKIILTEVVEKGKQLILSFW